MAERISPFRKECFTLRQEAAPSLFIALTSSIPTAYPFIDIVQVRWNRAMFERIYGKVSYECGIPDPSFQPGAKLWDCLELLIMQHPPHAVIPILPEDVLTRGQRTATKDLN